MEIEKLPVYVHPTTPPNFECQPGCLCCCRATTLFPSEVEGLKDNIKENLVYHDNIWMAKRCSPGVCVFFDPLNPLHCGIFDDRPLRCKLYPYVPLIVGEAIWIFIEPFLTPFAVESRSPSWHRCYGLGKGTNVIEKVKEESRAFLTAMAEVYPNFLQSYYMLADPELRLNDWEIKKFKEPLFSDWDTEKIRTYTKPY